LQVTVIRREELVMATTVWGVVKGGSVVPSSPLPEGAQVEIRVCEAPPHVPPGPQAGLPAEPGAGPAARLTPAELRRMPREQRQAILAAAAELAERDYHSDKGLTGFEAFAEEGSDDDESDSR
jgi:hypothetical protein